MATIIKEEEKKKAEKSCCTLCGSPTSHRSYTSDDRLFCCAGCHAVYHILSAQQSLEGFRSHPIFQQALSSGLISNPDLLDQARQQSQKLPSEECQKLYLEISEMWCPSCAEIIRFILIKEKGVRQCIVDYSTDLASIEYTPRYISQEKILKLIEKMGYKPSLLQEEQRKATMTALNLRFIIAAFFALNIMMFAYPIYASYFDADTEGYAYLFAWLSLLGALPVLSYSAWPIWKRFYTGLKAGVWGMEALVLLGVSAAAILSIYELARGSAFVYFDSMTVIIAFVLLGKIIESKSKFSAKRTLLQLSRALPRRGRKILVDGTAQFVPIKEIAPQDKILILSGEKIVLDGVIEEGEGTCDESLMTGESLPLLKKEGDLVLGGTILQKGHLVVRVLNSSGETALSRIVEMIQHDVHHKGNYIRAVDLISRWFVPFVLCVAIGTALYCALYNVEDPGYTVLQTIFVRSIAVLLISCPCALGIAAPLVEAELLQAFASLGAIVRNRESLALLGRETSFIFDKTGTITEGSFTVLRGLEQLNIVEASRLKGLVSHSNHPLSVAIHKALPCQPHKLDYVEEVAGKGIWAKIEEHVYYLGSAQFLEQRGVVLPTHLEQAKTKQIETLVFFAKDQACLACFVLGDRIRSGAPHVVKSLSSINTWLVSGDATPCVQAVAELCQFKNWHSMFQPLQKRELIDTLRKKGEIVAMLGDGINDAPALTAAHIGIAVVSATDISIQVSDILLTTDRLDVLLLLRNLARKGQRIIKQNLFWAFFYNIIGIGLAIVGLLTPLFAAFAMVISSLIVLLNAKRTARFMQS